MDDGHQVSCRIASVCPVLILLLSLTNHSPLITGPLNVMIPFTLFAAAFTYAWPFADSVGSLIPVTIIYGFCSGMYVSLMTNPIMNLGGEGDVGRRIGMYMSILAIGALVGPPCSGLIQVSSGGFEMVGIFAGERLWDFKFHNEGMVLTSRYVNSELCCSRCSLHGRREASGIAKMERKTIICWAVIHRVSSVLLILLLIPVKLDYGAPTGIGHRFGTDRLFYCTVIHL